MRSGWGAVPAVLLALVLLFVPSRGEAYAYGPLRERASLGDWRLTVRTDRFSGERRCRLVTRKGNASYRRGIIAIHLSRVFDPSETVLRADGGAAVRWRGLIPELARLDPGFASDRDPQKLQIPAALVKGAQLIEVSPAFGKRARRYRIAGLDAALDQAVALGCRSDTAFVR